MILKNKIQHIKEKRSYPFLYVSTICI